MFRFLKRDTPELAAVREFKRLRRMIRKEGGAEKICYNYWKFIEDNELFHSIGIVLQEDAPYPRMVAILSALDLLNSWKRTSDDDPQVKAIMERLSKLVYVQALLSATVEDLKRLHSETTGRRFAFELDSEQLSEAEQGLRAEIASRREEAEAAWLQWRSSDIDVLDAIRNA